MIDLGSGPCEPACQGPDVGWRGQPFTYDLFDDLRPSEFERAGSWFAESSEPPNCCWAYRTTTQFRRDSIRRDRPYYSRQPRIIILKALSSPRANRSMTIGVSSSEQEPLMS
jgi:hypothetical protein